MQSSTPRELGKKLGFSPVELLDETAVAMREMWSREMSAGRPEEHDKDPGYGSEVQKARERKKAPVGPIFHGNSIWVQYLMINHHRTTRILF